MNWKQCRIKIAGQYLNPLKVAENILLLINNIHELLRSIEEGKGEFEKVDLKNNPYETKVITDQNILPKIDENK